MNIFDWRVLPRRRWMVLFALAYAGVSMPRFLSLYWRLEPIPECSRVCFLLACAAAFLYGASRVYRFYPRRGSAYGRWLSVMPWTPDKPLPLGPIHLTPVDLVVIATLCALASFAGSTCPVAHVAPGMSFLAGYILILLLTFEAHRKRWLFLIAFILPLLVYPHRSLVGTVTVALALMLIVSLAHRAQLRAFPWNTAYWTTDPIAVMRRAAARQVPEWAAPLAPNHAPTAHLLRDKAIVVLLLIWWLHVLIWHDGVTMVLMTEAYILLMAVRCFAYVLLARPPISLWGRLRTRTWIVPRYDQVLLAPAAVLVAGMAMCYVCGFPGYDHPLIFEAFFAAALLLAVFAPPSITQWRLTGGGHLTTLRHAARR